MSPDNGPRVLRKEFKYTTYGQYQLAVRHLLIFTLLILLGSVAFTWVLLWSMGVLAS